MAETTINQCLPTIILSGDYPVKLIDQDSGSYPSQLSLLIEPTK